MLGGHVLAAELSDFFKNADQRAANLLESGDAEAASALFKDSQWQGVSQYRSGNFDDAMQSFSQSVDATALYNHGTAAARAGDYNLAVNSLEAALNLAPQDKRIAENLEIARKLSDIAQSQNDQQQQQGDQESPPEDESEESEQQSSESEEQTGEQPSDEQPSDNQQSEQGESQTDEPNDEQQQSEQDLEDLREQMQAANDEQESEQQSEEQQQAQAQIDSSVSEDDQAAEQWLRRIPDDASQLLRMKIRVNHGLEYPDVQDMQENW